jgi:hypothetical protein
MSESRAADYIAFGMNRGVDRFLEGIEKRKEEEKRQAKEFKSLVDFAESSGMLTKEQAMIKDLDSLRGFVQGKMYADESQRKTQESALREFAMMQKLAEFQQGQQQATAMQGFQRDFNNSMVTSPNLADFYENPENYQQRPQGDPLAAFQSALTNNPTVAPSDLNTFMSSYDKAIPPQAKTYAPTDFTRDMQEWRKAQAEGREEDATYYKARVEKAITPSGMRIEFDDQGRPIITQGDLSPTTAFKTRAQEAEANAAATFATIDHIVANQKASDWGVRGLLGKVQDEWLAQAVPGLADPRRIDVHASINQLRQQAMSALKAETQLSQKDKEELLASAPKIGPNESPQSGMQKIARFRQLIGDRIRAFSKQIGKPPPIYAMTFEQIVDANTSGQLSDQEAIEAIRKYHPERLNDAGNK